MPRNAPRLGGGTTDPAPQPPRLMDQVRQRLRVLHYSIRTEQAYVHWIKRYILWHNKRHPRDMGAPEVESFLSHLAVDRHVSASTQNQALAAILFLYQEVLEIKLPWLTEIVRAKRPQRLPTVLTVSEVNAVLAQVDGTIGLMVRLLYGTGMRLMECVRLRVKDLDFEMRQITVRDGKGGKDRITVLPGTLVAPLQRHIERVRRQRANGPGSMCFRPDRFRLIHDPKNAGGTMWTRRRCSVR